jgi:hypothetical protein
MGGAIEETDLNGLMDEMCTEVRSLHATEPQLGEEEVTKRVWKTLSYRGLKTRQMRSAKLSSSHANLVCTARSLGAARDALKLHAPCEPAAPPPCGLTAFRSIGAVYHPSPHSDMEEIGMRDRFDDCSGPSSRRAYGGHGDGSAQYRSLSSTCTMLPFHGDGAVQYRSLSSTCTMPQHHGDEQMGTAAITGAAGTPVILEESAISFEQVQRMYKKGKVTGWAV